MPATYDNLQIDETFPRNYEIECLVDMPNSPSIERYFFGLTRHGEGVGAIPRVTADGRRFIAVVGDMLEDLRLATWPNPWYFLARSSLILVDAKHPATSTRLKGFEGHSLHYAIPLAERGLILVGHCCGVYCYDSDGLLWALDDAFCCDDPVVEVSGDDLILMAMKCGVDRQPTPKVFDLLTGHPRTSAV